MPGKFRNRLVASNIDALRNPLIIGYIEQKSAICCAISSLFLCFDKIDPGAQEFFGIFLCDFLRKKRFFLLQGKRDLIKRHVDLSTEPIEELPFDLMARLPILGIDRRGLFREC